jgi:fucose permease
MKRRLEGLLIGIAYLSFVVLGMSSGLLGVAWPSIRESFGLSLDAVGILLIATTIGYLLSSFSSGPVISRIGVGTLLMVSSVVAGAGLLGCSLAPTWWAMVLLGVSVGMGSGAIDAGVNTYFATNHSASLMNWLHANFGVGAALGPAIVTMVLNMGQSWRWGYATVGILQALLAVCFGFTLDQWRLAGPKSLGASPSSPADKVSGIDTLRLPVAWLGIALFFIFVGVESAAGQWPYTLFTEARSVAPGTAGLWISIYWGSLTVGRVVFGVVVDRLGVLSTLRTCMFCVILGSAFVWWNVTDILSFLGLALIGFALGPLFPSLISDTPRRLGAAHAPNAIGFQVAAASLGVALLPGLAGVLAENLGLEVIGPFLLVASIVMSVLYEMIVHHGS